MAEISEYGKDRMRPYEKRISQLLVDKVKESNLSQEFKDNFSVSISAKYQTLTLIVPRTTDKELGEFEYDVLNHWAEENNVGWDWGDERDTYYIIDWTCN